MECKQKRSRNISFATEPLCMRHVPKSQHALPMESFSEELIIKTWSGMEMTGRFQIILK